MYCFIPFTGKAQSGGCSGAGAGFVSEAYINTTGASGGDYTINSGGALHIGPNGNYTIFGAITNNGTILVDAGGVLTVQGDMANNGTVTVTTGGSFTYYGINWANASTATVNGGGDLSFTGPQQTIPATFLSNSACLSTYTNGGVTAAQNLNGGGATVPMDITLHENNAGTVQLVSNATSLAGSLSFDVDNGYIVANAQKFIFGATATYSNASTKRYIQTNTTSGEVEKLGLAAGSTFRFPVGFNIPSDYTPAEINVASGSTDNYHVNVANFATSTPSEAYFNSLPNVQRTWQAYSDASGAVSNLSLYHYTALENNGYNDASTEVYRQLSSGNWQPGASATCAAETSSTISGTQYYAQTIQGVTLPACAGCSSTTNGSYYTKTMCAAIAGIVWDDGSANAVKDGSEPYTNGGGLFANLLSGGTVLQSVAVNASTGAYAFNSLVSGTYNVVLTNTNNATTSTLNSGWVHTGVNLSGTPNTGNKTGIISVPIATTSVTNQNFGILQCTETSLAISASASPTVVCASSPTTVTLTSTPSGGVAAYSSYLWTGSGITNTTTQNTTANPTTTNTYNVTVTDALGCKATGNTASVMYDLAAPSLSLDCNETGTSLRIVETNGVSWLWTTTSGGRFYTSNAYSVDDDSDVSHLPAPFIRVAGMYYVSIIDAYGCAGSGSLNVLRTNCSALAINNLSFTAARQGNTVNLQWQVVNETATKNYVVERSTDGASFIPAGNVTALNRGNNTYTFKDDVSYLGCVALYYRIKETGINGTVNYSKTIKVNCNENDASQYVLKVYPNPVSTGSLLTASYTVPAGVTKAQLILTDVMGKQHRSVMLGNLSPGILRDAKITITGDLAAGTYFLKLVSDKWVSKTIKVVKQ